MISRESTRADTFLANDVLLQLLRRLYAMRALSRASIVYMSRLFPTAFLRPSFIWATTIASATDSGIDTLLPFSHASSQLRTILRARVCAHVNLWKFSSFLHSWRALRDRIGSLESLIHAALHILNIREEKRAAFVRKRKFERKSAASSEWHRVVATLADLLFAFAWRVYIQSGNEFGCWASRDAIVSTTSVARHGFSSS